MNSVLSLCISIRLASRQKNKVVRTSSDQMSSNNGVQCRRLEGKVAIVTASTPGIGLGIVRRLGAEGAKVVVSSRREANVQETVATLRSEGLQVAGIACHVGDTKQLQRLIQFTLETYGRLDILVSNAAVNPAAGPITEMEDTAIEKILDINGKKNINLISFSAEMY